jgi:hypothetical protein
VMVQARPGDRQPSLPLRLIILRKPPEATASTRKRLCREASRKQKKLDPRSLVAAEFIILCQRRMKTPQKCRSKIPQVG